MTKPRGTPPGWAAGEPTVVGTGYSFLESPRWHDGRLFVSDMYTQRVLAFHPDGAVQAVANVPGRPGGLGFLPGGSLLAVSMTDRLVLRAQDGVLVTLADLSDLVPWPCNDMLVDRAGRAYVGHFGADVPADPRIAPAELVLVDPDGRMRVVAEDLVFPNGMVMTDDGQTLLVAETFAARISAFDVADNGSLTNRRTWASFTEGVGDTIFDALDSGAPLPDGMALDTEGAVWIGDLGGRGALRVVEGGEVVAAIDAAPDAVYALALGGVDRCTLYMCVAPRLREFDPAAERKARLLACRVDVPGAGIP